jgi:hypothetical protein
VQRNEREIAAVGRQLETSNHRAFRRRHGEADDRPVEPRRVRLDQPGRRNADRRRGNELEWNPARQWRERFVSL